MSVGTSIEQIAGIKMPSPLSCDDFNYDPLQIGDTVLFAIARGRLAEGTVIELDRTTGLVTVRSLNAAHRTVVLDAQGTIKI